MSTETDKFNFTPKAHISISRVDHCTSIMKSVDDIFQVSFIYYNSNKLNLN